MKKITRPDMKFIEVMFDTMDRPSGEDSREMANWIYHLEKIIKIQSDKIKELEETL